MKRIIALTIFIVIIIVVGKFLIDNQERLRLLFEKQPIATINNRVFKLLVAKTDKDKEVGLSERDSIGDNVGMLFSFGKADYYSFWMKNMKFPIDILFVKENKIVTIHKNVPPPKTSNDSPPLYTPTEPADSVLEFNAGVSEKYKIQVGDTIKIENLK